jgi:hypothetical protein
MPAPTKIFSFVLSLILTTTTSAFGQVVGCKDPAATNFNAAATIADSSCIYTNTPTYTPSVKLNKISDTLTESSGLQWTGNSLWSFNDEGSPSIYRIDTTTGFILQKVTLQGATNGDWEDIAFDGTNFYIGDFGNNFGGRTDLKIYKFPLSAIPDPSTSNDVTISSSNISIINFTYADQVPVVATPSNQTKYDCEAMIVDGGKIHLFTKNWIGPNTTHYVISSTEAGNYTANPVEMLTTNYLVTGADKVPGSNIAVLLGYENGGFFTHHMHVLSDFSGGLFFTGNRRKLNLPTLFGMGQAEGITFLSNSRGFISNEPVSAFNFSQKLFSFITNPFVPLYVLPVDLINFNVSQTKDEHTISWHFGVPVKNLSVLRSTDGVNFTSLRMYSSSSSDRISVAATSSKTCYKLQWQQAGGSYKYSQIVCVDDKLLKGFSKIVLKKNGELMLVSTAAEKEKYTFNLIQMDGKKIAQSEALLSPGTNNIRFSRNIAQGSLIFLQAINHTEQKSILLRVE